VRLLTRIEGWKVFAAFCINFFHATTSIYKTLLRNNALGCICCRVGQEARIALYVWPIYLYFTLQWSRSIEARCAIRIWSRVQKGLGANYSNSEKQGATGNSYIQSQPIMWTRHHMRSTIIVKKLFRENWKSWKKQFIFFILYDYFRLNVQFKVLTRLPTWFDSKLHLGRIPSLKRLMNELKISSRRESYTIHF